jgi:TatD DNase family protein
MELIDTHCHIHDSEFYPDSREEVYAQARDAGVFMLCVGTDERSSKEAVAFAKSHDGTKAIVGVHPHEAKDGWGKIEKLIQENPGVIVGIGEIGLDYFYSHSPKEAQQQALREQLALAVKYNLPVSFHVREAFDDFWPIFDEFSGIRGVLHSFTDTKENLQKGKERGLKIGVNGISTFTKDEAQQKLFTEVPLDSIVLETDAPFLTPKPFRGKMNVPAYIGRVAEHQAVQKDVSLDHVIRTTTDNAKVLFGL